MTETLTNNELLTEATIEKLLKGKNFLMIENQLLFYHESFNTYVITEISEDKNYTADDYLQLPENAPFQLINSKLIFMPSPFEIHQKILFNLSLELGSYVKLNESGIVRFAPLDVHFDEENIVQPDLIFISIKRSSIIQKWIFGAPDFVVEILSKSTEEIDRTKKMELYGKHNVIEYWIVNPEEENIEVYHNEEQKMELVQTAEEKDEINSRAIEGLVLKVESVFK